MGPVRVGAQSLASAGMGFGSPFRLDRYSFSQLTRWGGEMCPPPSDKTDDDDHLPWKGTLSSFGEWVGVGWLGSVAGLVEREGEGSVVGLICKINLLLYKNHRETKESRKVKI